MNFIRIFREIYAIMSGRSTPSKVAWCDPTHGRQIRRGQATNMPLIAQSITHSLTDISGLPTADAPPRVGLVLIPPSNSDELGRTRSSPTRNP